MISLKKIKLFALDVDGVLLNDTYSPVIKKFIEEHGGIYTPDLERAVWGSPHIAGGHNIALACKLPWSARKTINAFFQAREQYLEKHPVKVISATENFLKLLHSTGAKITSYGGRPKEYSFDQFLKPFGVYFDEEIPYVDTNEIRPGVEEIVKDIFHLNFNEVVFVDDINRVAEVTKALGAGFIGTPVTTFQKKQMIETSAPFIFNSISEIDEDVILKIDQKLEMSSFW